MPDARQGSLARGATARTVAGAVFPPGVHLAHSLNSLAGGDSRVLYALLFDAVADTLNEFAANTRWLGGTLTASGEWVAPKRGFLFPVKALSRVFRGKFLNALDTARDQIRHDAAKSDAAWRDLFSA